MEQSFQFIDDFYTRHRLVRLFKYIEKNDMWDIVRGVSSSYDSILDKTFDDCGYTSDYNFSMDMAHMRTIGKYGWKKYFEELRR